MTVRQTDPASLRCGPWARHIYPSLVLVQPRKNRPYLTERLLMGRKESNQTKQKQRQTDRRRRLQYGDINKNDTQKKHRLGTVSKNTQASLCISCPAFTAFKQ